jgi:hypothetical protein
MCTATASSAGSSDAVESSDWSNPIEVAADGEDGQSITGVNGLLTVSGHVYLTAGQSSSSTPATPYASSYNISAGTFGSLKPGWSTTPPPTIHANLYYFAARYWGTESSAGSGNVSSVSFSSASNHLNLDGVVTFTNTALGNELGPEITVIDGGMIDTGTLSLDALKSSSYVETVAGATGNNVFSLSTSNAAQIMGGGYTGIVHIESWENLVAPIWVRNSVAGYAFGAGTFDNTIGPGCAGYFVSSADSLQTGRTSQTQICSDTYGVRVERSISGSVVSTSHIGNTYAGFDTRNDQYTGWSSGNIHTSQINHDGTAINPAKIAFLSQIQCSSSSARTKAHTEHVGIYLSGSDGSSFPLTAGEWHGIRSGGGNILSQGGDFDNGGGAYIPFTGAHLSVINKSESPEIGDILIDQSVIGITHVSESLTQVVLSSASNQKATIGIFNGKSITSNDTLNGRGPSVLIEDHPYTEEELSNHYALQNATASEEDNPTNTPPLSRSKLKDEFANILDTNDIIQINALGEGAINVCGENGDFEAGDLIVTSSTPGKGMKQDDDIIRSYTVGKVRENVTFSDPAEVKLVACIYLCG